MKNNIEHLKALAGTNNYIVTNQDLTVLSIKYNLSESEITDMMRYCEEHGIMISEEKENYASDDNDETNAILFFELTSEQKEHDKLARKVADRIMDIAVNKALKEPKTQLGWFCGRYFKSIKNNVTKKVRRMFSIEQLHFIIDHLLEGAEEEFFNLEDQQEQDLCTVLNRKLNELIPKLRIERFNEDFPDV